LLIRGSPDLLQMRNDIKDSSNAVENFRNDNANTVVAIEFAS
jgi:hypothetical protein